MAQDDNQIGIRCPHCKTLNIELIDSEKYYCKNPHSNSESQYFIIGTTNRPKMRDIPQTSTSGTASLSVASSPLQQKYSHARKVPEPFAKAKDLADCKRLILEELKVIHTGYQRIQSLLDDIPTHLTSINMHTQIMDDSIWNLPGLFFFNRGNFSLSEMVYSSMLEIIRKKDPSAHKGLALYHLGIAQVSNGNLDEGVPNILNACNEDALNQSTKASSLPAFNSTQNILKYIGNLIDTDFFSKLKVHLPSHFTTQSMMLLAKLPIDEHLFLTRIMMSNKMLIRRNDTFTKIILFDNLLNIYILIETFLRTKKSTKGSLGNLVQIVFCNNPWYSVYKNYTGVKANNPNSLTCYDDYSVSPQYPYFNQLSQISTKVFSANIEDNFIVKMFLSSLLTRNYLAHGFDSTSKILNNFAEYDKLFMLAIGLLMYSLV